MQNFIESPVIPEHKKIYRLKNIVLALTFLVVGIGITFFATLLENSNLWFSNADSWLLSIGQAILIGGMLNLAYEVYLREDIIYMNDLSSDRVINVIKIDKNISHLGLVNVFPDSRRINFSKFLLNSKEITLLLNDGRTWFSNHEADLEKRIKNPELTTNVILVHPESEFVPVLADKVDTSSDRLKDKIEESVEMLKRLITSDSRLKIYGHLAPTTGSIFISEEYAYLCPYPMARKADAIPTYLYKISNEDCYYNTLKRDTDEILTQKSFRLFPDKE